MCSKSGIHVVAWNSLPVEMVRLIVDNLPRSDLFSARLLSKTFAAITAVGNLLLSTIAFAYE